MQRNREVMAGADLMDNSASCDRVLFQSPLYPAKAMEKMTNFKERNNFTDIVLVAGDKEIPCHKVVISSLCDYFSAMFTSELSETRQDVITISEIDPDALMALVDYAYTWKIEIRVDNVENLLASACLLQVDDVKTACCDFMKNQLHPSNCLGIRAFADTHGCDTLFQFADKYTQDNFIEVSQNQEFLLLSSPQLCSLLKGDYLNVTSEKFVYQSVITWLKYDYESRKKVIGDALECVRLVHLDSQFIVDEVSTMPAIRESNKCKDILLDIMKYHLMPRRQYELTNVKHRPRKGTVGVLYAIGGMDSGKEATVRIDEYNPRANSWKHVASMSARRLQFGVAILDNKLYVAGGRDGLKTLNNVECFDPVTSTWTTLTPMLTHRHGIGVAVLNGPLYAVGGHDGWSYLNTVERYDPQTKQWKLVASMGTPRSTVAVTVLENRLYAVGGRDGSSCLNSVEVYDPNYNRWTYAAPMIKRRGGVGVSVLNGYLYALGGHDAPVGKDSSKHFSSAERYDVKTDQWTLVKAMRNCRDAVGLSSLGDKLYAVGGYDGALYLEAVEAYDPESDDWAFVAPLYPPRAGACVVSLMLDQ